MKQTTEGISAWIRENIQKNPALNADDVLRAFPQYKGKRDTIPKYFHRIRKSLGIKGPGIKIIGDKPKVEKDTFVPPSFEKDVEEKAERHWEDSYRSLKKEYDRALKAAVAADRLVAIAHDLAPRSYDPAPRIIDQKPSKNAGAAQTAFLVLSDTHVGQVVTPEQTLGFGGYNFEIFLARLKYVEQFVISQRRDFSVNNPTDKLFIAMLGDMIHGALGHSSEADQHSTKFAQFYAAAHAIAQFLRNLSVHFKEIEISTTVGNHPRWGDQKKMPTVNRYSNLDQFLYAYIAALVRDIPSINMPLNSSPFQVIDVEGFLFHLAHGDHLRGGDKALGIPNHSVGRQINATTQLFAKSGLRTPDYYVVGHFHRPIDIPHAKGKFLFNGGFPGLDGYALDGAFNPVEPSQLFFLVHPEFGMHSRSDIQIWRAQVGATRPYELPAELDSQFPIV